MISSIAQKLKFATASGLCAILSCLLFQFKLQINIYSIVCYFSEINENTKVLCNMLLSKKSSYSQVQKNIASNINYRSNGAYKYMRNDLQLHLPCTRSLYNYNTLKQISPGFDTKIIHSLKAILDEVENPMKDDLEIILIYDEIPLRRELVFNTSTSTVDGFEDFGFERTSLVGKKALVFIVFGLNFDLIYPLNYFVSSTGIKAHVCKEILKENLRICTFELNVKVTGTSSDQGSNFRSCSRSLKVITQYI